MFVDSVANLTIFKVIAVNRLRNSPVGITTHRHNRSGWGIALKTKGKTIYTVDGTPFLSDHLHPVLLPKGSTYSWKCIEPGECIIVEFETNLEDTSIASIEISDNSAILNAFSKIEKSINKQEPFYHLRCCHQLYEILLFLAKSMSKESPHPQKQRILYPAMQYITENYFDSGITNASLSRLCGISTVYFRKTFEFVYGIPPIKYLHNFRIKKAQAILLSDYESVEQVALSVGYNSIYHFSKMFKEYTGKSPTEYAKQHKNTDS